MTPELCRGARGILGWSQGELADRARLSRPTIADYERGSESMQRGNRLLLELIFRDAGVEFVGPPEQEFPGIRVLKPDLLSWPDEGS